MAIESAAELVNILVKEIERSGSDPHSFAKITGIANERLELLYAGAWESVTVEEISIISKVLEIDPFSL